MSTRRNFDMLDSAPQSTAPEHPSPASETGNLEVTFVFPCLNEERSLATCIAGVRQCFEGKGVAYEIVVADNGSTDKSVMIAESLGCRVIPVRERGYGAALQGGIRGAKGRYVIFADSDETYLYEHALALYEACHKAGADMAIASRMKGVIEPGAMPPLHRHLGTPVLTSIINLLFRGRLSDCNSGFRCLRKEAFLAWDIRSNGMEFASELLIKALKARAPMVEIPSGLRCGPAGRVAHLRTWRDGMRHLLFIFSEKPQLFEITGLTLVVIATLLQLLSYATGPVSIFGTFHVFDIHSQVILLLASILGTQFYLFSCTLYLQAKDLPLALTRKLIHLNEGVLFFFLLTLLSIIAGSTLFVTFQWSMSRFSNLNLAHELLLWAHVLGTATLFAFGLLSLHILKKAR